jgi:uncharacterized protein YaaQ
MPKLLIVVLHQQDAERVVTALEDAGHRLTQIPSIGGFLRLENVTLLLALEETAVDSAIAVIERYCSSRDLELPLVVRGRLKDELPGLIRHGGATIMVADLDRLLQL